MNQGLGRTVRFLGAQVGRVSSGNVRAFVEVERSGGERFVGTAEGAPSDAQRLRCAAEAALEALRQVVGVAEGAFQVRHVNTVEVSGRKTVVVALSLSHRGETRSLLGICAVEPDATRAAALAVFHAANRFLGVG